MKLIWVWAFCLPLLLGTAMAEEMDLPGIRKEVQPNVFLVKVYDTQDKQIAFGSGFFGAGCALTNLHVIKNARKVVCVLGDGSEVEASGYYAADNMDLAALDLPVPRNTLPLEAIRPEVGERIAVFGSPEGFSNTLSDGIVSAIRPYKQAVMLQITAPISAGSSGSPVVNTKGRVVGVATLTFEGGQALNFAISAETVAEFVASLEGKTAAAFEKPEAVDAIEEIHKILLEASRAFAAKNYGLALKHYRAASELDPNHVDALYGLGLCLIEAKSYKRALEAAERILAVAPEGEEAWLLKGRIHLETGDYEKAEEVFRVASQIEPNCGAADINLAYICHVKGLYAESKKHQAIGEKLRADWLAPTLDYPVRGYVGPRGYYPSVTAAAAGCVGLSYTIDSEGAVVLTGRRIRVTLRPGSSVAETSEGPVDLSTPPIRWKGETLVRWCDMLSLYGVTSAFNNPSLRISQCVLLDQPSKEARLTDAQMDAVVKEMNAESAAAGMGVKFLRGGKSLVGDRKTSPCKVGVFLGKSRYKEISVAQPRFPGLKDSYWPPLVVAPLALLVHHALDEDKADGASLLPLAISLDLNWDEPILDVWLDRKTAADAGALSSFARKLARGVGRINLEQADLAPEKKAAGPVAESLPNDGPLSYRWGVTYDEILAESRKSGKFISEGRDNTGRRSLTVAGEGSQGLDSSIFYIGKRGLCEVESRFACPDVSEKDSWDKLFARIRGSFTMEHGEPDPGEGAENGGESKGASTVRKIVWRTDTKIVALIFVQRKSLEQVALHYLDPKDPEADKRLSQLETYWMSMPAQ